jgi:plasmid segregation protein ParM
VSQYKENLINEKRIEVEFEGRRVLVGESSGVFETDMNKVNSTTKLLIMTSLALTMDDNTDTREFYVMGSLPIALYSKQKENLKKLMLESKINKLKINGKEKHIIIADFDSFPQSAAAFYSMENVQDYDGNTMVIDLGGRTLDVAQFTYEDGKRKLEKYTTHPVGAFTIYEDIINTINSKYDTELTILDAEKVFSKRFIVDGAPVDTSFIYPIIKKHAQLFVNTIRVEYPLLKTSRVLLAGGLALILAPYMEEYIKEIRLAGFTLLTNRFMPVVNFHEKNGFDKAEHTRFMYKEI